MSESKLVPFSPGHADLLEIRDLEVLDFGEDVFQNAKNLANLDHSYTLIRDGRVLCIMGFWPMWAGTAEVFVLPSKYLVEYPFVVRNLKKILQAIRTGSGFHRLQSASVDDPTHNRFMEACGFICEGKLKRYSKSGRTYKMWSIVDD